MRSRREGNGRSAQSALVVWLLVALVGSSASPSPVQAASASLSYYAYTDTTYVTLCPEEFKVVNVYVRRLTFVNGTRYGHRVGGGTISRIVGDLDVAYVSPVNEVMRSVGGPPEYAATFEIVGSRPGKTEITFLISSTGEEARVGSQWPKDRAKITVEVVGCYEAYTSGLASTFSKKYIGDFRYPFYLEGRIESQQLEGSTQYMFFIPNPQNGKTGGYAFIDTYWTSAGPGVRCTLYVSGRYDAVFYPDELNAVEGDLLMKGSGVAVCPDVVLPIDYRDSTGFQVGFRPFDPTP